MIMTILKSSTTIKCTSDATNFDGQADAPVQYRTHCPMEGGPWLTGIHWTPPPDEYSHCIASAAARATANKTTIKKYTIIAIRFNSRADAPV
jgi:hypothetical protein